MTTLSQLDVLIVDCQTTGATPNLGAVLELGWGVTRASDAEMRHLQAHWIALPEGHRVPFQVRRLTGFDEREVSDVLQPQTAWERLRACADSEPMPTAIHFAQFELVFLRDWAARFEPAHAFPLDAICVHAIACRLFPDLPRRSLRALAGFLGRGVDSARRCLEHVEATAFVWRKLVDELATKDVHDWQELGAWLKAPSDARRSRKRRYPLPAERYRTLPDAPGVYHLLRSNGDLLYVGKATSLRKRVASHFTAGFSRTERALEMLTQVHDLQVTNTATALEAALLENEIIKTRRPPYNIQLLGDDVRTWFATSSFDALSTEPDDAHRWGPLPSTFAVRALGTIAALLSGEVPTLPLRASAVGAPPRFAPDEATFAAGFSLFVDRHEFSHTETTVGAQRALFAAARKLLLAAKTEGAAKPDVELAEESDEANPPNAWDGERVLRHLERAVAHGYQLLQRARWLCLLYDSLVVFHEPPSEKARWLEVRGGHLLASREVDEGEPFPEARPLRPRRERQIGSGRHHYDRLRTLTTELKRILRDGGSARVRIGGRWFTGDRLNALLRWV